MERNYIQEALAHYNITVPEIELLNTMRILPIVWETSICCKSMSR